MTPDRLPSLRARRLGTRQPEAGDRPAGLTGRRGSRWWRTRRGDSVFAGTAKLSWFPVEDGLMRTGSSAPPPGRSGAVPADGITHGQHACGVVTPGAQQQEVAVDFVTAGLRGGDRVWYLADADTPRQAVERLRAGGVDTDDALASGQLAVLPAGGVLPGDGPSRAGRLSAAIGRALASGYRGFRVTCEMSWAARAGATSRQGADFEAAVGRVLAGRPAAVLCLYDPGCFAPGKLD